MTDRTQSAAEILDFLYAITSAFESRYFARIRRYHSALRADMMPVSDAPPRPAPEAADSDTDSPF